MCGVLVVGGQQKIMRKHERFLAGECSTLADYQRLRTPQKVIAVIWISTNQNGSLTVIVAFSQSINPGAYQKQ